MMQDSYESFKNIFLCYDERPEARPQYALQLSKLLQRLGYQVFQVIPQPLNASEEVTLSIDESNFANMEKCGVFVFCISREFKNNAQCKRITQYVHGLQKNPPPEKNTPEILFALMQGDFTTTSQPGIDGWLRHVIKDSIWYSAWSSSQIRSAAEAMSGVIYMRRRQVGGQPSLDSPGASISSSSPRSGGKQQQPQQRPQRSSLGSLSTVRRTGSSFNMSPTTPKTPNPKKNGRSSSGFGRVPRTHSGSSHDLTGRENKSPDTREILVVDGITPTRVVDAFDDIPVVEGDGEAGGDVDDEEEGSEVENVARETSNQPTPEGHPQQHSVVVHDMDVVSPMTTSPTAASAAAALAARNRKLMKRYPSAGSIVSNSSSVNNSPSMQEALRRIRRHHSSPTALVVSSNGQLDTISTQDGYEVEEEPCQDTISMIQQSLVEFQQVLFDVMNEVRSCKAPMLGESDLLIVNSMAMTCDVCLLRIASLKEAIVTNGELEEDRSVLTEEDDSPHGKKRGTNAIDSNSQLSKYLEEVKEKLGSDIPSSSSELVSRSKEESFTFKYQTMHLRLLEFQKALFAVLNVVAQHGIAPFPDEQLIARATLVGCTICQRYLESLKTAFVNLRGGSRRNSEAGLEQQQHLEGRREVTDDDIFHSTGGEDLHLEHREKKIERSRGSSSSNNNNVASSTASVPQHKEELIDEESVQPLSVGNSLHSEAAVEGRNHDNAPVDGERRDSFSHSVKEEPHQVEHVVEPEVKHDVVHAAEDKLEEDSVESDEDEDEDEEAEDSCWKEVPDVNDIAEGAAAIGDRIPATKAEESESDDLAETKDIESPVDGTDHVEAAEDDLIDQKVENGADPSLQTVVAESEKVADAGDNASEGASGYAQSVERFSADSEDDENAATKAAVMALLNEGDNEELFDEDEEEGLPEDPDAVMDDAESEDGSDHASEKLPQVSEESYTYNQPKRASLAGTTATAFADKTTFRGSMPARGVAHGVVSKEPAIVEVVSPDVFLIEVDGASVTSKGSANEICQEIHEEELLKDQPVQVMEEAEQTALKSDPNVGETVPVSSCWTDVFSDDEHDDDDADGHKSEEMPRKLSDIGSTCERIVEDAIETAFDNSTTRAEYLPRGTYEILLEEEGNRNAVRSRRRHPGPVNFIVDINVDDLPSEDNNNNDDDVRAYERLMSEAALAFVAKVAKNMLGRRERGPVHAVGQNDPLLTTMATSQDGAAENLERPSLEPRFTKTSFRCVIRQYELLEPSERNPRRLRIHATVNET